MTFVGGAAIPSEILAKLSKSDKFDFRFDDLLPSVAPPPLVDILPSRDVIRNWPIRDQHRDPTCVAFAVSAGLEFMAARERSAAPQWLSPAYLYWKMRSEFPIIECPPIGYQAGATLLRQARDALCYRGICRESSLSYGSARFGPTKDGTYLTWVEPKGVDAVANVLAVADHEASERKQDEASLGYNHLVNGPSWPTTRLSRQFHRTLSAANPVIVAVPVWPTSESGVGGNWATVEARRRGVVRAPCDQDHDILANSLPFAGHAVCLVGFKSNHAAAGGGWFIFRNSLGADFGRDADESDHGVPAPGYGAISVNYIDFFCWEYLCFE